MSASAGQLNGTKIKIKQEPIMAIGKKGPNSRRQTREQYKSGIERKLCTKCGRALNCGGSFEKLPSYGEDL